MQEWNDWIPAEMVRPDRAGEVGPQRLPKDGYAADDAAIINREKDG